MNWKLWGRGLLAAFVSGAANSLAVWTIDSKDFNFEAGLLNMGKLVLVSGLIGAGLYLKTHPLPNWPEFVNGGR